MVSEMVAQPLSPASVPEALARRNERPERAHEAVRRRQVPTAHRARAAAPAAARVLLERRPHQEVLVRRPWVPSLVLVTVAGAASAQPAGAPDPATVELFVRKCASCHTVGKGDRVGPDLKGAVERRGKPWVERFVAAPSTMLDSDPQARELLGPLQRRADARPRPAARAGSEPRRPPRRVLGRAVRPRRASSRRSTQTTAAARGPRPRPLHRAPRPPERRGARASPATRSRGRRRRHRGRAPSRRT